MDVLRSDFNAKKAVEVILFLANALPEPTFHNITHLLYFADKVSLKNYGRFICGDDYYAMQHGPAPSSTYSFLKLAKDTEVLGLKVRGYRVIPLREPNLDELSESDIECLEGAVRSHRDRSFDQIKAESHDEAYRSAWSNRGLSKSAPMSVESIATMLDNTGGLLAFLANRHSV